MPVMIHYDSVNAYIEAQPPAVQPGLQQLRKAIKEVLPDAEEVISYCMPAFKQDGIVVWYAAAKKHFALYPKSNAILAFKSELSGYNTAKGTIRFPMDQPLPLPLIRDIAAFRLKENEEQAALKNAAKKKAPAKKTIRKV